MPVPLFLLLIISPREDETVFISNGSDYNQWMSLVMKSSKYMMRLTDRNGNEYLEINFLEIY